MIETTVNVLKKTWIYKCSVWYVHQGVMISTFNYNVFDFRQCLVQHIVAYIHGPNDFVKQGNINLGYLFIRKKY